MFIYLCGYIILIRTSLKLSNFTFLSEALYKIHAPRPYQHVKRFASTHNGQIPRKDHFFVIKIVEEDICRKNKIIH